MELSKSCRSRSDQTGGDYMKKLFVLLSILAFTLSACNTADEDKKPTDNITCFEDQELVNNECVDKVEECEAPKELVNGECKEVEEPLVCDAPFVKQDGVCFNSLITEFKQEISDVAMELQDLTANYDLTNTSIEVYEYSNTPKDVYIYTASYEGDLDIVRYMVAMDDTNEIINFKVLEQYEVLRYGGFIASDEFKTRIVGLTLNETITGAFDGIAGSTITSEGFKLSLSQVMTFHKDTILELTDPVSEYCTNNEPDCIVFIEELIDQMTLLEKAAQMVQAERGSISPAQVKTYGIGSILSGGGSHPTGYTDSADVWYNMYKGYQEGAMDARMSIPLIYGIDSVHGNNNLYGATIFPHNIGLGMANDPDLMFRIGEAVAKETKVTGITWTFAPALSVVENIRWGRTYEGFSENPEIHMNLTYQTIMGMQQFGVSATAKHFFGDGGTVDGVDQGNTIGNEARLREIHLAPYYEAIRADVDTVMISYSSINGIKLHGYEYWIQDVLKDEMGFKGFIISDWNAIHQLPGGFYHQVVDSVNAGVDMLMEPTDWEQAMFMIRDGVNNGDITEERVDDAVRRILQIKYKRGLFDDPYGRLDVATNLYTTEHQELAREAARKSLVLLKNDNDVLPLNKSENIYLAGPGKDHIGLMSGGWTTWWQGNSDNLFSVGTSIEDGLVSVLTSNGASIVSNMSEANTVVIVLAETPYAEGAGDTSNPSLVTGNAHPENAAALQIAAQARAQGKTVIGILLSGRPLILGNYINDFDGFIAAWLPGSEGGSAISDVIFGDYDFMGKLSFTWPKNTTQLGMTSTDELYDPTSVMYPYGYGLSYLE